MTVNANRIPMAQQILPDSSGQVRKGSPAGAEGMPVSFTDLVSQAMSQQQAGPAGRQTQEPGSMPVMQQSAQRQDPDPNSSLNQPIQKENKTLSNDRQDAVVAAAEDIADGVAENVKEELGVSEEDLEEVMETLGLTYMDLLNPQALTQVVEAVDAAMPELTLDVEQIVAELIPQNEEVIAEALSDNAVSLEEFGAFFEQVRAGEITLPDEVAERILPGLEPEEGAELPQLAAAVFDTPKAPVTDADTVNVNPIPNPNAAGSSVTVIRIEDDALSKNPFAGKGGPLQEEPGEITSVPIRMMEPEEMEDGPLPVIQAETVTDADDQAMMDDAVIEVFRQRDERAAAEAANPVEEGTDPSKLMGVDADEEGFLGNGTVIGAQSGENETLGAGFGSGSRQGGNLPQGMMAQMGAQTQLAAEAAVWTQPQQTFAEGLAEAAAQTPVTPYTAAQTADIMNQIITQASMTITETVTRMEMELNPQSLGRMIMQVQQQEGVVMARLIAQSDNVRAALETQLAQLRENLELRGIRVDAVEVTVGTHEFERNLEEGMAQGQFAQQQEDDRQSGRPRMRNLNRGEIDDVAGELTEEEALAAQIMRDSGGTVDYTA